MSIRIITDSTADMTPQVRQRVQVVPMLIRFGDKEYLDGVDITSAQFYEMLTQSQDLPTTSQIPPATFQEAFREAVEAGDQVVCLTISSKLSGTYQSACIAAAQFPGQVFAVDSQTVAMSFGILVDYALTLVDRGLSAGEIAQALTECRSRVKLVAVVDTLEYLKKGGRISATVAFAGGLLNIKPIIAVDVGEVKMCAKARGGKQVNAALIKEIENFGGMDCTMPLMFGYTGLDDGLLVKFMEEAAPLWQDYQGALYKTVVGSTVGTHAGPGAAAVAFFAK